MKVFEDLLSHMGNLITGIAVINKEGETVFKGGEGEILAEGVGILGSAGEASLKNIGMEQFSYIKGYLKDGSEIYIIEYEDFYVGIKGEGINIEEIKNFIQSYKEKHVEVKEEVKVEEEKHVEEKTAPVSAEPKTPLEKFAETKLKQINELIKEFAPGDEIRWGKVVYAKIKDVSPEFARLIKQEDKIFKITYPLPGSLTEEIVNKSFRSAIDIIWKMGVSKYGAVEAKKKVKNVADRLKMK